jgi:hypothetical protein
MQNLTETLILGIVGLEIVGPIITQKFFELLLRLGLIECVARLGIEGVEEDALEISQVALPLGIHHSRNAAGHAELGPDQMEG